MTNPGWLNDIFAAVMIAVAAYSAGRLVAARTWSRPTHRDVDVAHVLMGTAMAGMLVSDLNPIPSGVWEVVFSVLAAWFIWRCYQFVKDPSTGLGYDQHVHRLSRRLIHLVMSLAMLYMYPGRGPSRSGVGGQYGHGSGHRCHHATSCSCRWSSSFRSSPRRSGSWTGSGTCLRLAPRRPRRHRRSPQSGAAHRQPRRTRMPPSRARTKRAPPWLAPRLEGAAHIVMCVTMGYMLVLML